MVSKSPLALVLCIALIGLACSDESTNAPPALSAAATEEDLARMAFDALMQESAAPMRGGLPTAGDFDQQVEQVGREGSSEDLEKARAFLGKKGGAESRAREAASEFEQSLPQTRQFLDEADPPIDWAAAEFAGLVPEHSQDWNERGYVHGNRYFQIRCDDVFYTIKIEEVMRVPRGWVCGDGITMYREPEGPGVERLRKERWEARERPFRLTSKRGSALSRALDEYCSAHRACPESLDAMIGEPRPDGGTFTAEDLEDGWGNPFVYRIYPDGERCGISSAGPDGVPGNGDDP